MYKKHDSARHCLLSGTVGIGNLATIKLKGIWILTSNLKL